MPLYSVFPNRYRQNKGAPLRISPGVLSPVQDDELPALRQTSGDQSQDNSALTPMSPAPPSQPNPAGLYDTKAAAQIARGTTIDPNSGSRSRFSGIRKLMPAPGTPLKKFAAGETITTPQIGVVGEDGPEVVADANPTQQVDTGALPLPPLNQASDDGTLPLPKDGDHRKLDKNLKFLTDMDAASAPGPASPAPNFTPPPVAPPAPPPEPLPAPPNIPVTGAPPVVPNPPTVPAQDLGTKPQTPAEAAASQANQNLQDKGQKVQGILQSKPAAAPNNWAQRLGLAVLSLTKFGPIANQLIHPKWAEQQRAYQSNLAGASDEYQQALNEQKAAETAMSTEALAQQREAAAEQKKGLAQKYVNDAQDRQQALSDREYGNFTNQVKALGAIPIAPGENVPQGYYPMQDPRNPNLTWVTPHAFMPVPPELANKFPGQTQVPSDVYAKGLASKWADDREKAQVADKTPANPTTGLYVARALGKTTGNPIVDSMTVAEANKAIEKSKENPQVIDAMNALTPESLDVLAQAVHNGGSIPSGFSRNPNMVAKIVNRYSELYPNDNITANKALYDAARGSLDSLQKQRDAVVTFENTAGKNLDLFLQQAKPIIDSGSPWINQPLRAVQQGALGSADIAAYNVARQVALNEIAKVTSNPGLSGQLSDSARKEVHDLLPESATLAQIYRVAGVLKQDMENRRMSYDQQLGSMHTALGAGSNQPANATSPPSTTRKPLNQIFH